MPPALIDYIMHHGYGIIFLLVFLQELNIPNPVPNEVVLLYAGYLASTGHFVAWFIIATAVAADFIGTSIFYGIFYIFGMIISKKQPKWLPMKKIEGWKEKVSGRGKIGIFLGRLLPYVRGYTSAAAGLLDISPKIFLPLVFCSAIIWSGGLVFAGKLLGPHIQEITTNFGTKIIIFGLCMGAIFTIIVLPRLIRKKPSTQ